MVSDHVIHCGDCREVLPTLEACSVDAVVTDPPAGISFMGKDWDHHRGGRDAWVAWMTEIMRECLRVLKPGGHALVWAIPRTSHWTAWAIESAGFEIRDRVSHLFGSGFPKSLSISKTVDAAADYKFKAIVRRAAVHAVERAGLQLPSNSRWDWTAGEHAPGDKWWRTFQEWIPHLSDEHRERIEGEIVLTVQKSAGWFTAKDLYDVRLPVTEAAKQWNGWETALKPACEDWWLCRKPIEGTVAENVMRYGTGGLNINACRIAGTKPLRVAIKSENRNNPILHTRSAGGGSETTNVGRWPSHVIHDGSDEVLAGFPETHAPGTNGRGGVDGVCFGHYGPREQLASYDDSGSAARFFYCAKASREDREDGLDDLPVRSAGEVTDRKDGSDGLNSPRAGAGRTNGSRNHHPTVKATELMRYLCRLITPPNGLVLDPFCGSGSTGKAAMMEGFRFIGIESDPEYVEIAKRRIEAATRQGKLNFASTHDPVLENSEVKPAQSGVSPLFTDRSSTIPETAKPPG